MPQVHDQHIWAVSPDKVNLSAHIVLRPGADQSAALYAANAVSKRVGIFHTVFQVEDSAAFNCEADADHAWPCVGRTKPAGL